jgi:hypothetical protein
MYLGRNSIFYITYKDSFKLAGKDTTLMKDIYQTVPRNSKKDKSNCIGHSTRMALW